MTKTFSLPTVPADSELKIVGETLRKGQRMVFAVSGNTALLDVAARNTTKPETHKLLDDLVARVNAAKLSLSYVSNVRDFFDPKKRWEDFLKTGTVEGLELTDEETKIAEAVATLRAKFERAFQVPTVKLPYVRLEVPEGADPLVGITFNKASARRGTRSLTYKTLEALWKKASPMWAQGKTGYGTYRSYDGYYESPSITATGIKIGCKTISRLTMEALATRQGWADPVVEV